MQLSNLLHKSEGNHGYDTAQADDIRYRRWQRTRFIGTGRPQANHRRTREKIIDQYLASLPKQDRA
jgi:hypothetical protein